MTNSLVRQQLKTLANEEKAEILQRFFKTGPGGYGEGDRFLGIQVPLLRKVARQYKAFPLKETEQLLYSPFHEERLLALLMLVLQYKQGDEPSRAAIYRLYLQNTAFINNWDLVDVSAEHVVGAHLFNRSRRILYDLARSVSLWERRIAVMATFHFIRREDFADALDVSRMLLADKEDLIHKAVGWMLREIGKRDLAAEQEFLNKHCRIMPRTMLRYAIEKFPEDLRKMYMRGEIG